MKLPKATCKIKPHRLAVANVANLIKYFNYITKFFPQSTKTNISSDLQPNATAHE